MTALVDYQHAEDNDRELPGEEKRIPCGAVKSQHHLAGFDDREAAFDRRGARPLLSSRPLSSPEIITSSASGATAAAGRA